jgi:hypothetical protein
VFRAATVPGILPSELSPHRDRVPLSRSLCSPAVIHQHAAVHCLCALSPPISSTPTLSRSRLTPSGGYERPFHGPRPTSRLLWAPSSRITTFCQLHLLRSFDPPVSPFSISSGCPVLAADTLLVSFLSRVFSNHASGPRPAQATRTQARSLVRRLGLATEGTSRPLQPGETLLTPEHQEDFVDGFRPPYGAEPDHLSVAPLLPWSWSTEQARPP